MRCDAGFRQILILSRVQLEVIEPDPNGLGKFFQELSLQTDTTYLARHRTSFPRSPA